jgi:MinD-like ATPase involved in chromosome partitioning or flagellar assembly
VSQAEKRRREINAQETTIEHGEKAMRDFVMYPEEIPNVNVLASPEDPDLFYDFGSGDYQTILRMLGKFYDVIIIDSGTDVVLESQRSWLAHANQVFLVTTPELDRLYNTSRAALYIARSRPHPRDSRPDAPNMPPLATSDKMSVIMNRADVDSGLDVEKVVDDLFPWLGERQRFFVPDVNKEMLRANNQGEFLSISNPIYAEKIAELANHLFARYADMKQKRALPGQN